MYLDISSSQSHGDLPTYRSARPLPDQLLDHSTVCLEEQLYSTAFQLLSSALTAGHETMTPAQLPPPQHLALAATLSVHPALTTRTTSPDKHEAADEALRYLRHVVKVVGPRNDELNQAFQFTPRTQALRGKRRQAKNTRLSDRNNSDSDDESYGTIRSSYVDKDSLWQNVEDFWAVVGWALNCSIVHKARWQRWRLWLDLMLDVLEAGFEDRLVNGGVSKSLLAWYLDPIDEGRSSKRRLMRAILADGRSKSMAEFTEVWRNETKKPKVTKTEDDDPGGRKKRKRLDLENGDFGDYFDNSDDESTTTSAVAARPSRSTAARASRLSSEDSDTIKVTPRTSKAKSQEEAPPSIDSFGGGHSLRIRRRLLALLIRYCCTNPTSFLDTEDLLDLYTEFLNPLPLPLFEALVLPARRYLGPHEQSSLDQMLLRPLLSTSAPAYNDNALTQSDFELYFAPFTANHTSFADNAKVALVIEDLARLLWRCGQLQGSEQLTKAVEAGINARNKKAAEDGRRRAGPKALEEKDASLVLEASGARLRALLGML